MSAVSQFLNSSLALTHPELHQAGLAALMKLRQIDETREYAREWESVFSGIAVIANRKTPAHRDHGGSYAWYDLLASIGSYKIAELKIPDLGIRFLYTPGTVAHICGNLLTHEVDAWGEGDRICYAHFMRKNIFNRLDINEPGWSLQSAFVCNPDVRLKAESLGFKGLNID